MFRAKHAITQAREFITVSHLAYLPCDLAWERGGEGLRRRSSPCGDPVRQRQARNEEEAGQEAGRIPGAGASSTPAEENAGTSKGGGEEDTRGAGTDSSREGAADSARNPGVAVDVAVGVVAGAPAVVTHGWRRLPLDLDWH